MEYHDEADEDADGTPQQVGGPKAEGHTLLAIDGARRLLELAGLFQQSCDLDLVAVLGGSALGTRPVGRRRCCREESDAVAFDARDQVVSVDQQPAHNFIGGILGVGHEVERLLQSQ